MRAATLANMKMHKIFLLAVACTWSAGALAQWQWTDKDGRKVFSDRAPPADMPPSRILKQPHGLHSSAVTPPATDAQAAPPPPIATAMPPPQAAPANGTDKELEEKKAKAEAAEAAQKKVQDNQHAAARANNCRRAQSAKADFDFDRPVRQTNAQGERVILDGKERTAEVRRIQSIIESDCKR